MVGEFDTEINEALKRDDIAWQEAIIAKIGLRNKAINDALIPKRRSTDTPISS